MATFQKSNWTRTTSSEHSRVYAPNAVTAGNVTGNGGATVVTVTVPFQFQGNGQVEATLPVTGAVLNSGLSLGTVVLLAPAAANSFSGVSVSNSIDAAPYPDTAIGFPSRTPRMMLDTMFACTSLLVRLPTRT